MSATDQPAAAEALCGKWMPRAGTHCARRYLHPGKCVSAQALKTMVDNRPRKTTRRRGVRLQDDPAVRARWRRTNKLGRFGITEAQFDALLEAQGNACAICREPFEDQRPRIDHDHACCPVPPTGVSRSCGKCVRGLLCVRCNTWLGWMEKYDESARAYLSRARGSLAQT